MNNITIAFPVSYDTLHYEAVCCLLRQLTTRDVVFTPEDYIKLTSSPYSKLFLLLCDDKVMGMLTVGMYLSPTGSKAWIEDVVVDESQRGSGLGRMLVEHAIEYCKKEGVDTLYLTSNPKRIVANGLYQSVGFDRKETNMYKMDLKK